jgi:hypothetical protein
VPHNRGNKLLWRGPCSAKIYTLCMGKRANIVPVGKQSPKEQLSIGYQANAEESLDIAFAWAPLEEEAWEKCQASRKRNR